MRSELSILDRTGDLTITWDHADPVARVKARLEVQRLKAMGYTFFLVDGSPADEINAGQGTLVVRRIEAEEIVGPIGPGIERETAPADPPAEPSKKRRGRPPKVAADRNVVAVRPMAGG